MPTQTIDATSLPSFHGHIRDLVADLRSRIKEGYTVTIISNQTPRLLQVLPEHQLDPETIPQLSLINASLLEPGWSAPKDKTIVYTDYELFGLISSTIPTKTTVAASGVMPFIDLSPGCYVVHADHGIGKFLGITEQKVGDVTREYFVVAFKGADKLYVPTTKVDRLTKYVAASDAEPELSGLGSKKWQKVKEKARKVINTYTKELTALYAERTARGGHAFPPDDYLQKEIALSFPYIETPDQNKAMIEIKADMEKPFPMDRLVCGDVGFGKTEVALRAAVKAAVGGKQVAFLVPTTVLAEQHYHTFTDRLRGYPIKVTCLSRFQKNAALTKSKQHIAQGTVDIVIGTHRLLQKDISFHNLGLLIIDEEQRFGVKAKEKLKETRATIDVLALTATPIPRTLQLSLAGLRDISVLASPPPGRLPISTHVVREQDKTIRDAIVHELDRGGQVFIIHNRVQSILSYARSIAVLVPEATVGVVHGQMNSEAIEEQLYAFATGKTNVLVATNLIENGIDIPNANTILVSNANHFGLADLYQLRGRVGRSNIQAYAYFLYKPEKLPKHQIDRLKALEELSELGSGFELAMRDLDMRGAGTLLGTEQSGLEYELGYELYTRMVRQEVDRIKHHLSTSVNNTDQQGQNPGQVDRDIFSTRTDVDLVLSAYLPASYIANSQVRLHFYQSFGLVENQQTLDQLASELRDRFGPLPPEVDTIIKIEALRLRAQKYGITSIKQRGTSIILQTSVLSDAVITSLQNTHKDLIIREEGEIELKGIAQNPKALWKLFTK